MPITIAAMTVLAFSSRTRCQMSRKPTNVTAPNASDTSVSPPSLKTRYAMISVVYSGSIHCLPADREREQVMGDHLVVIDHPLAGDEVPEDVRITTAPYEHAEDHDERGDHQKLPGRDAS